MRELKLDRGSWQIEETEYLGRAGGFGAVWHDWRTCSQTSSKSTVALAMDCDLNRTKLTIVAAVISLGAAIGVKVVVEGVEKRSEVEALRGVGARFMQGFYFARPSLARLARDQEIPWMSTAPN